ncbi:MAG: hypothetical protein V1706_13150 [Pseudomonadota bacterium]
MDSDFINTHYFLADGPDLPTSINKVNHFFASTVLVKYEQVRVEKEEAFSSVDERFAEMLDQAIAGNGGLLNKLLGELEAEGFAELSRWSTMPQGYLSKTVHAVAHMLDGFFGVDSAFYNLVDDSHWVSETLMERIKKSPDGFWLIKAVGISHMPEMDRIPFLRRHGRE